MQRHFRPNLVLTGMLWLILSLTLVGCTYGQQGERPGTTADQTIIDQWTTVPVPPAPELKPVTADPKTTALLILDMQTALCKYPRSMASIARIAKLSQLARDKGMLVVYSLTSSGQPADIVPELTPLPADPIVKASVDKFYNTALAKILEDHGVHTVIITGTAANGAVLYTATGAAVRGYQVVVPVDGMSASDLYAEQYTAWHMLNSPGTRNRVTLSKVDLITF